MAGWNEILNSVDMSKNLDSILNKSIKRLSAYTGRNVIVYYSGWQQKTGINETGLLMTMIGMDL